MVGMLWWVCLFNYADRQAIFSVFPLLKTELHLSDVQLGMAGSSFMWAYAVFGPAAGWLCDRLSRKTVVLGGLMLWSAATAATAHSHSYGELLWWRSLGGLAEAFYFPASMSLIGDYHGPASRSRAMSIHQSSVYIGSVAGGALSGFLGQRYSSWRASFLLFGFLGIALGLVLMKLLREPERGMSEAALVNRETGLANTAPLALWDAIREVLGQGKVLLLVATFVGANFVAVMFLVWMPTYLYTRFHMGLAMAGLNGALYLSAASCVGVLFGGWLADRLVARRVQQGRSTQGARMMAQSAGLLIGGPFLFLAGFGTTAVLVLFALACVGFCKGIYDSNIWASLYDVVPVRSRGAAAGVMNSIGWLGGGIAPVAIAAASARFGMGTCISATAAIYLAFGVLLCGSGLLLSSRGDRYSASSVR